MLCCEENTEILYLFNNTSADPVDLFAVNDPPVIKIKNFSAAGDFVPTIFSEYILPALIVIILARCIIYLMSPEKCRRHAAAYSVCTGAAALSIAAFAVMKNAAAIADTNTVTGRILDHFLHVYDMKFFLLKVSVIVISVCTGIAAFSLMLKLPLRIRALIPSGIAYTVYSFLAFSFPDYTGCMHTMNNFRHIIDVPETHMYLVIPMFLITTGICLAADRYEPDENIHPFRKAASGLRKFIIKKIIFKEHYSA